MSVLFLHLPCSSFLGLILAGVVFQYDRVTFGDTPVSVIVTTYEPIRFIAQIEDQLFSLEYRSPERDESPASVHCVWMTDNEKPEWRQGQVSAMAVAQTFETPFTDLKGLELVCVDRASVHVAILNYAGGPKNVYRRLNIGGTPTRAVYSEHLRKLIVLYHRTSVIRPPRTVGGRTYTGKRALQPVIMFLDPDNNPAQQPDDDDMDVDPGDAAPNVSRNDWIGILSHRDHQTPAFEPGERFLGVTEWFPKVGDKEYHMLIVHTMIKADETRAARSRLLLFSVLVFGDRVGLTLKKDTAPSMPIYALATHPNRTSIVYHSGEELRILRLEATDTGLKWSAPIKAQLRSPARHITIQVPYIYVFTAGNSLAVFLEKDGFLEFFANDTVPRQGLHHLNIPAYDLTVTADMGSSITGLWKPPYPPRIDNSLSTLFEASLPQASIRLQPVRLPIWLRERNANIGSEEEEEIEREWLFGQRVLIGIATTGIITQHRLLLPHQWPFLRFLQNLAERSPIICPFRDGPTKCHLDPARSTKPETRAINGDILMRLLDRGGVELILNLMNKPPILEERYLDFDSVGNRWERFKELSVQFLTTMIDRASPELLEDESRLVRLVLKVLETRLSSVL